jgi:pimeloyl-ACP methyl ester carboxylesterase
MRVERLRTGADVRISNDGTRLAAVFVNGGTAKLVPGTWSATSELLVSELASRFLEICFVEVRYRVKTWKALESCTDDAHAALRVAGAAGIERTLLVGFSMGGAVAVGVGEDSSVAGVLGLAPWLPPELPLDGLCGKRLDVVHGAWDRYLPGVPGVSPGHSHAAWKRAQRLGIDGTYTVIPRALHGCAVRSRRGNLLRLPRWRAWVEHVAAALDRFAA